MSSRVISRLVMELLTVFVVAIGLVSTAQADVILANRWAFDGSLSDSSGNGNTGTLSSGTATYIDGVFGQKAISLGTGQSIDNTAATNLPTDANDAWSINFWYKAPGSQFFPWLAGFGDNTTATDGAPRALVDYDGMFLWGSNADSPQTNLAYGTDALHMITATYQLVGGVGQYTLYYDGDQKSQGALTGSLTNASSQIHVNQVTWSGTMPSGVYQEFTIWSGALTQAQVTNLVKYNSVIPEPCSIVLLITGTFALLAYAWRKRTCVPS